MTGAITCRTQGHLWGQTMCVMCGEPRKDAMPNPHTDEIEQLHDRIERLEEALWRVSEWENAYPLTVFPEPDADYWDRARVALKVRGLTLDRIAASNMRHVVTQIARIARTALKKDAP